MANPLTAMGGPPPAPNPNPQPPAGQGNAFLGAATPQAGSAPAGQQAAPAPPPAPSHQQVVAGLRHFSAIERELTTLLKDPAVGKSDVHSKIIDGMTKLVADRMIKPGDAVQQLGTVPERPFDQKQWLQNHLQQTVQAQAMLLDHHRAAFAGQQSDQSYNPDDHANIMSGLLSHYQQGAQNAR